MENLMKHTVFSAVVVFVFAAAATFAQADLQPVATVKIAKPSEQITVKNIKDRVSAYEKQLGTVLPVDKRREVLDALIDEKLVVQAAQKAGLSITDAQVNQYFINNISRQLGQQVTEQQFAVFIKQNTGLSLDEYIKEQVGMNVAEYKLFLKSQLLAEQYVVRENQDAINKITPTDKEIRDYYALNQSSFVRNETLRLFLVIVKKGTDITASRKRITDVLGEVKAKQDLSVISKRFVNDPDMKAGDIYVARTAQAARELNVSLEALGQLFAQNIGYVSEITETPTDFQFYVMRERLDAKMLSLSDEFQPESATTIYEVIRSTLAQEKQSAFLTTAIKDLTVKLRVTPQNYEMLRTGDALNKLLAW
jgi:hypothetical protein